MKISVSLLPDVDRVTIKTEIVVVIDVLRATSVMTTALAAGALRIMTYCDLERAREFAAQCDLQAQHDPKVLHDPKALLCGERGCEKIPGFDLGNSPSEYTASQVAGKPLVLTTTNGTRAIDAAVHARQVLAASFLNLDAVIRAVGRAKSLHLVCAGTNGEVTAEDVSLAGAIVDGCETRYRATLASDEALIARQLWRSWFPRTGPVDSQQLCDYLKETRGGKNLLCVGYERDLLLCSAVDSIGIVPQRTSLHPATFECKQ